MSRTVGCKPCACHPLKSELQLHQLDLRTAHCDGVIDQLPRICRWIDGIADRGLPETGDVEASRHANEADSVEPARVLGDLGLKAGWSAAGRKAVCYDGMADLLDPVVAPLQARKYLARFLHSKTGCHAGTEQTVHPTAANGSSVRSPDFGPSNGQSLEPSPNQTCTCCPPRRSCPLHDGHRSFAAPAPWLHSAGKGDVAATSKAQWTLHWSSASPSRSRLRGGWF